jgi:hypothetical protein
MKFARFFTIIAILLAFVGCSVFKPATGNQSKIEAKAGVVDGKLTEESRALTTGALDALGFAPTNPPTQLAKRFLERDQQIEGVPAERIDVAGILATNKAAIESLERRFLQQQQLLEERTALRAELEKANARLLELGRMYEQEKSKSLVGRIKAWVLGTFGLGGLIALVIFCPAALPIIGSIASFLVSRIPSVANLIGVVGKSAFDAVCKGVGNARSSLKEASKHNPDKKYSAAEVLEMLDTELKESTEVGSANFRPLIEARRSQLNV